MRRLKGGLLIGAPWLLAGLLAMGVSLHAQEPSPAQPPGQSAGGHRGQFAGMGRVTGEITAVSGSTVTVKAENGDTVQVVTTDNTRLMKDRAPVKVTDLHPGDGLMAFGNMDASNHTLHAAMVMAEDAAQLQAMRANLGKTYISGRVTRVDMDDAKITVERPDHVAQTLGLDETTSFRRVVRGERSGAAAVPSGSAAASPEGGRYRGGMGRGMGMADPTTAIERGFARGESITLADIKVGDFVLGTGAVKAGIFVPTKLLDTPPGPRRQPTAEPPAPGTMTPGGPPETDGPGR